MVRNGKRVDQPGRHLVKHLLTFADQNMTTDTHSTPSGCPSTYLSDHIIQFISVVRSSENA